VSEVAADPVDPAVDPPALPIPSSLEPADVAERPARPRPRASVALQVLATLAVGYTLWAAQDLVLPVLLAIFFALVGNPILRLLQRLWIPRFIGAVLVLSLGMLATVQLGRQLVVPAAEWVRQVPGQMRDLAPKLRTLVKPVREANKAAENIARGTQHDVWSVNVEEEYHEESSDDDASVGTRGTGRDAPVIARHHYGDDHPVNNSASSR